MVDTLTRLWLSVYLPVRGRLYNRNEKGAALVEYALLVGLIAVVCITAITALGGGIKTKFTSACSAIAGSTAGC